MSQQCNATSSANSVSLQNPQHVIEGGGVYTVTCVVSYLRFETHVCSVCGWWTLHTGLTVLMAPPSFLSK